MATATLTSQLTDESLDPGSPSQFGTANAQQSETDINLQGANCSSMGHSGTVGTASPVTADSQAANSDMRGMYITVNIARDHNHVHCWVRDLYPVRNKSIGGVSLYLANGTSQECLYYASGIDAGYLGNWLHIVANLSTTDRAAADLGTLPGGNVNRLGYAGNISVSKGEDFLQNSYLDAVRYGADGVGITFSGGVTGDRLLFSDMAAADATTFYGLLRDVDGSLRCEGPLTFGGATLTTWIQDSLRALNFAAFTTGDGSTPMVAADYYRIVLADGTTGVTQMHLTDWIWNGVSRALPFQFDANLGAGDAYTSLRGQYKFGSTITLGLNCTSDGDVFIECVTIVPDGITLNGPRFSNCDAITLTDASDAIDGGASDLHNTATGVAYITTDDPSKVSDHTTDNTGGTGHFMEATAIGTFAIVGTKGWNTGGGYAGPNGTNLVAASGSNDAGFYNNSGGLITLNLSGGAEVPSVRNGAGATTQVNLSINYELTGLDAGAEVTIVDITVPATPVELLNEVAGIDGIVTYSFDGGLTGTAVGVYIRNTTIENVEFDDVLPAVDTSFPVPQPGDTVYLP